MALTPEQQKAVALANARLRLQEKTAAATAPKADMNAIPGKGDALIKTLTDKAMAAYSSGDDAEGKRLLVEASRAAVDAGQVPEGIVADPRTGGMIDLTRDQSLDMGKGKAAAFGAMQGLGFNFGDEAIGGIAGAANAMGFGDGTDAQFATEKAREMDRRAQDNPWAYYGGYIPGAVASSLSIGKALGLKAPMTTKGVMAQGAAVGGAEGGVSGFGAGQDGLGNRMTSARDNALLGAALGGIVAPALGAGVQKGLQWNANRKAIADAIRGAPSTADLRAAGNAAYKAVDDAGVVVRPEAFSGMVDDVTGTMRRAGLDEGMGSLTPQSSRVATIMEDAATKPNNAGVPFSEIDLLRRKAGVPAANMSVPLESSLGTQAIGSIDDFVRNLSPEQVAAGDAKALPGLIDKARETWARMSKSQMIDDAMEASQNYLSGSASGIRNQFSRILKSPKLSRGFSDLEKAAMRRAVNGSASEKMLNLLGGGMGQLATMGVGGATGGIPGMMIGGGIASLARRGSEALAGKNAEIVRALVASGKSGALPQVSGTPRSMIEALIRRSATGQQ